MQQRIASLRDELSKKDQALRSITGKVRHYNITRAFMDGPELIDSLTLFHQVFVRCSHLPTVFDTVSIIFVFYILENLVYLTILNC